MPKLFSLSIFLAIFLLVGCQPKEAAIGARNTDNDGPEKPLAKAETWTVETADGFEISCWQITPEGKGPFPCVILAHMLNKDHASWAGYQVELAGEGYASVAFDLRGHGKSLTRVGAAKDREFKWNGFSGDDWGNAWMDAQAVLEKLGADKRIDSGRIGIAGGSIGANVAVVALSRLESLRCAAALSPSFKYKEVSTEEALKTLNGKPLLVWSSEDDHQSYLTAEKFPEVGGKSVTFVGMTGSVHGTNYFEHESGVREALLEFFDENLSLPDPAE